MALNGVPTVARTPLEVLENDGIRKPSFLSPYYAPGFAGITCLSGSIIANWIMNRPLRASMPRHIFLTALFVYLGHLRENYRERYFADRDAMFRDYIRLHPEDFPAFPRKKFSEVLDPWIPIRA